MNILCLGQCVKFAGCIKSGRLWRLEVVIGHGTPSALQQWTDSIWEARETIMSANETPVAAAMSNSRTEPTDAACEWLSLEHLADGSERIGGMVGGSAQVRKLLKTLSRLGPSKATGLIHGESGTGEELIERE